MAGFQTSIVGRFRPSTEAFNTPIFIAALIGTAACYVLPMGIAFLGMKVTRPLIERSPEGRALMAAHDKEQRAAWQQWEEIKRLRAAGESVDEVEARRIEGVLFRNEGVIGTQQAYATPPPPPARPSSPAPIRISTDTGKRGPEWMLSNVGPELVMYFQPRPTDFVWKLITKENAPAYQLCFQQMLLRAGLNKLYSSHQIDDEIATKMVDAMDEVAQPQNLNSMVLLILAHQYVDADQMMRGLNTTCWVARMVARENFAPSPESYFEYLKERFFAESASA